MALSTLAQLMRRNAFQDFNTGESGPRSSPAGPALPGFARGSLGTSGARPFQSRNVNAGEQRERGTLGGPIGNAFMNQISPAGGFGGGFSGGGGGAGFGGSFQSPAQFNQPRFGGNQQGLGGGQQIGGAPGNAGATGAIGNAFGQLAGRANPQQEGGLDRRQQLLQLLMQRFGGGGNRFGGGR